MKKVVSSLCAMAILIMAAFGGVTFAFAGTYEDECDLVFRKALEEILSEEAVMADTVEVTKAPVYDLALDQLGFIYTMQYGTTEGFALVINTDGMFEVIEFYAEGENPYNGYNGQSVYVSLLLYLNYEDGCFVETSTGLPVDEDMLTLFAEKAFYSSSDTLYTESELIYYLTRTSNEYQLAKRHPAFLPLGLSNACTPTAGGNLIVYYDRFYEDLIPNFTPGSYMFTYYLYKEIAPEVYPVIETLYNYMGTNTAGAGTTIAQFRSGMQRYVNEKGRNIGFNSCMQSGSLDFNLTKQRLESGSPVVLFLDTYTVAYFVSDPGQEGINYFVGTLCHAMAGFGYNEITYTLTNGQTRTDKYIAVATGLGSCTKGYFNINRKTQIDECYAVTIN